MQQQTAFVISGPAGCWSIVNRLLDDYRQAWPGATLRCRCLGVAVRDETAAYFGVSEQVFNQDECEDKTLQTWPDFLAYELDYWIQMFIVLGEIVEETLAGLPETAGLPEALLVAPPPNVLLFDVNAATRFPEYCGKLLAFLPKE